MGTNAYFIDLPVEFQFSPIFNMEDLTTYHGSTSNTGLEETPSIIPHIWSTLDVMEIP